MFRKKSTKADKTDEKTVALPDPRISVKTTTAQSETTNSSVKNATIFNSNTNTVTFQTTRQTVIHTQNARVTEVVSRRTPTVEDLEEMLRTLNLPRTEKRKSGNFTTTNQSSCSNRTTGVSTKSSPKFKSNTATANGSVCKLLINCESPRNSFTSSSTKSNKDDLSPKSPSLIKIFETKYLQQSGSSMTSHMESRRINLKKKYSNSDTREHSTDTKPLQSLPPINATTNQNYVSPYLKFPLHTASVANAYKITDKNNISANSFPNLTKKLNPGFAYIFNNELFEDPKQNTRVGSSEDVKSLRKTFEHFKLTVTVFENAKRKKISEIVNKIETKDFSSHSCLIMVILSHGSRYDEVAARDGNYCIDDDILFPILRNRTLMGKPKLFFIQACKGPMEVSSFHRDAIPASGIPTEILKCYSTFEGYISYRSKAGSLFIQALCKNLTLFGNVKSIQEIMEKVTLLVKQQSENRQIPTITSTLTKPFVFGNYI